VAKPPFAAFEENFEQDPLDFLNLMTMRGDVAIFPGHDACLATLGRRGRALPERRVGAFARLVTVEAGPCSPMVSDTSCTTHLRVTAKVAHG